VRAESPREIRRVVATPITTDWPREEKPGAEGTIVPARAPLRRGAQVRMYQTRRAGTVRNPTLPRQVGEVEVPLAAAKRNRRRLRENAPVEVAGNEDRKACRRLANYSPRGRRRRNRDDSDGDDDKTCQQKPTSRTHTANLAVVTLRANTSSGGHLPTLAQAAKPHPERRRFDAQEWCGGRQAPSRSPRVRS
jgi:hypothetical protein